MGPHPAGLGSLESEGEGLEHLARAEPEEFVPAHLDVDSEMRLIGVPDAAVGAVGGDDQIVAGPIVEVGAGFALEMETYAQRARPFLQDVQQPLAANADEAMAGRPDRLAMNMDLDIVPMGEFALDRGARHG